MLAAGIEIPWASAQRFQHHVGRAVALPWDQLAVHAAGLTLPALRKVLDSPCELIIGQAIVETANKQKRTALVGAFFVPLVIDFGQELLSTRHDYLTKRCLLDILNIVFFKHSVRTVELAALGALQSIAEFCRDGEADENRLYGISILQMAMNRLEKDSLVRAVP